MIATERCEWLLMKRGLYERPDHIGYTGIRDNAGLFTEEDAKSSVGDGGYGVTMVRFEDAPEFTDACFDDLARDHLQRKIASLRDALAAKGTALSEWKASHASVVEGFMGVCEAVGVQFDAPEAVAYAINAKINNAEHDKVAAEAALSEMRVELERFATLVARRERSILADLRTAHYCRGPGASSEMRSDDRDDYEAAEKMFAAARALADGVRSLSGEEKL